MTTRLTTLVLAAALAAIVAQVRPAGAGCDPVGKVRFVCGQAGPEDLAVVPGGRWVIASGMAPSGGIRLIDLRNNNATTMLFPGGSSKEQFDRATYASCPGPIDPAERDKFRSHGL